MWDLVLSKEHQPLWFQEICNFCDSCSPVPGSAPGRIGDCERDATTAWTQVGMKGSGSATELEHQAQRQKCICQQ